MTMIAVHAQPIPCGNPAFMESFCADACVICDIDGFTGNNNSSITGEAPPGFCTIIKHHLQWIAFVAGTPNLTLEVTPTNCVTGMGLEIGIYKSLDCMNYQLVSNCNTDVYENIPGSFTNTEPLEVGQYYYFVMDGNDGDVCDYTIKVTDGSTAAPKLLAPIIQGPQFPCIETTETYTITPPPGATVIKWTLNGVPLPDGKSVDIDWTIPGDYELCGYGWNVCEVGPETCLEIHVEEPKSFIIEQTICEDDCITVADSVLCTTGQFTLHALTQHGCDSIIEVNLTVLPNSITNLISTICEGETMSIGGVGYNATGIYQEILPAWNACDSIINLDLTVLPNSTTNLLYKICDGDSVVVGNNKYTTTGIYQDILPSGNGCDSIINLDLQIIICEIKGQITKTDIKCFGDHDGTLSFSVQDGTPIFNYTYVKVNDPLITGNGIINSLNETIIITGLDAGTYLVTIEDQFGNDVVLQGSIVTPPLLKTSLQNSDYNGSDISCFGFSDGNILSVTTGGVPPYTYKWSNGPQSGNNSNVKAGLYKLTITDANNCTVTSEILLTEPQALALTISYNDPDCSGLNTGSIQIDSVSGGSFPYEYFLNALSKDTLTSFNKLVPDEYEITVTDINGCTESVTITLADPLIPEIELGPDVTIDLGDSYNIQSFGNEYVLTYSWPLNIGLSCDSCKSPIATPYNSTLYVLNVTSASGCTDSDSIYIEVLKNRNVYVPNAFSPNGDGINDKVTVFTNPGVEIIKSFQIYSRWGELVYKNTNFAPNELRHGWDGLFNGKPCNPATFVWFAEVTFLDGEVILYKGDINLLK